MECLQTVGIVCIFLWNEGHQPWVLTSSSQHAPPWLQGSLPWYGDRRCLHEVLSWHSQPVGSSGTLARVLSTMFWTARHQGWRSSWPCVSGIELHSCLMATPPELWNSYKGGHPVWFLLFSGHNFFSVYGRCLKHLLDDSIKVLGLSSASPLGEQVLLELGEAIWATWWTT